MTERSDLSAKSHDGSRNMNPAGLSFWEIVREDFQTHDRDFFCQGFWAVFWHRFGNWRMSVQPRAIRAPLTLLYRVMLKSTEWIGGIYLPYTVVLGRRVKLEHFGGMILVADQIGDDVIIRQNTTFGISRLSDLEGRPTIGDGVEIGAGAVIVGRVTVGANSVVGANAVVTRDVEPGTVVGGIPARVLSHRARYES